MINVLNDAASENSRNAGNPVSYAEMKALLQQNYTLDTIGRLAAKVLPLMKAVLEALVYACFIFIIPLCMLPSGYKFLLNWCATLVWLSFWSPVYAILNMVMNIAARASSISEIGTSQGITIANVVGLSSANAEIKVLAGYLALSVPFICLALVKGVGSFIHLAGQMTGATTSAAGSAVAETVNGNMSYGNVSLGNAQMGNVSELQRNHNSLLASGGHKVDTGGVMIINDAKGFSVRQEQQDSGRRMIHTTTVDTTSATNVMKNMKSNQQSMQIRKSHADSIAENDISQIAERVATTNATDLARTHNMSLSEAQNKVWAGQVRVLRDMSKQYSGGKSTQGSLGIGGSFGIGGNVGISANANTSAHASNTQTFSDSESAVNEKMYSEADAILRNFAEQEAQSEHNDEITSYAREYVQNKQISDSLAHDMASNQANIDQMENAIQHMQSSTVTVTTNATDDYVKIAQKQNPHLTENQAKAQMQEAGENDPAHQRVLREMQSKNASKYNAGTSKFKTPDTSKLNFNENELRQSYANEKTKIETKIANTENEIVTKQQNIRNAKKTSEQNFEIQKIEASNKITEGQRNIKDRQEQVKNSVDKRAKESPLKTAGKVFIGRNNYDKRKDKK